MRCDVSVDVCRYSHSALKCLNRHRYTVSLQPMALMLGTGRCLYSVTTTNGTDVGYRSVRKKSPLPPKFNAEVSAAAARKIAGGFFFAPACMTPHSNIELGGSGGRAFFLHRPVSSQVVFSQIHISSTVLRCSSQRDLAR